MPIVIDEMKLPITPAEARDIIQRQTDNFGVFFDVDRCYEIAAIYIEEYTKIVRLSLNDITSFSRSDW